MPRISNVLSLFHFHTLRALTEFPLPLRITIALGLLAALFLGVWRYAFPEISPTTAALIAGGVIVALLTALAAGVFGATVNQFILRNGGTDPEWLIFPSDPPGLKRPEPVGKARPNRRDNEA